MPNEISFTVNGPCDTDTFPEISTSEFNDVFLDTVNVSLNVEDPLTSSDDDNVVALDTFKLEETVTLERVDKPVTLSVEESVVARFTLSVEERVDALITFRLFKEVSPVVLRLFKEEYPVTLNELSIVVSLLTVRVPSIIVLPELSIEKMGSFSFTRDSSINGLNAIPENGSPVVPAPSLG